MELRHARCRGRAAGSGRGRCRGHVARGVVCRSECRHHGPLAGADIDGDRTAGVEMTAWRWIDGARHLAPEDRGGQPPGRVGIRDGGHERLRVGMAGAGEQVRHRGLLDEPAQVHHERPVADVLHDGQVVGDEHDGDAQLLLQPGQQVEDLRLDRHVERRRGLVRDDETWLQGECGGDAHPLPLAARQLVRSAGCRPC